MAYEAMMPDRNPLKIPSEDKGSKVVAASPTASHALPVTLSRRCECAARTEGAAIGSASRTRALTYRVLFINSIHFVEEFKPSLLTTSISLMHTTASLLLGTIAEYHHPSSQASTSA